MMNLEELKARRDIVNNIDWDMTPQAAFEAYQIKSINAGRYRSLPDIYFFYLNLLDGADQVVLVERTLKDSREVASIEPPAALVKACVESDDSASLIGAGQCPLSPELKAWLQEQLDY